MRSFLGQQVGNYHVEKELARGGFGTVYLARHTLLTNRLVAIKVLHDVHLQTPAERDAFLQEAQFLDQLKHPFILPLFDVGLHQETLPFLVMEYAASGSLRKRLDSQSSHPLPFAESLTILSQIGQALQYAHQQTPAIIHRDLKPENILFNQRGEALLADFGIATILSTASVRLTSSTGTPAYMAPEQFRGQVSRESDQYALGCVAYELLTGQRPFTAPDPVAMAFKHAAEEPIPLRQRNPGLPPHVESAVLKAMAKRREDRHADVAAFLAAFHADPTVLIDIPRKLSPFTGNQPPTSSGQEKEIEELDPGAGWAKAVRERIKQKNVPSTWHVLKLSVVSRIAKGVSSAAMTFPATFILVAVTWLMNGHGITQLPLVLFNTFTWMLSLVLAILTFLVEVSPLDASTRNVRLALMPNGFISFTSNHNISYNISYKAVEDIRFNSDKGILVVAMTSASLLHEIDISKFNESPRLIAQRVEEAYTSFKARNTLS